MENKIRLLLFNSFDNHIVEKSNTNLLEAMMTIEYISLLISAVTLSHKDRINTFLTYNYCEIMEKYYDFEFLTKDKMEENYINETWCSYFEKINKALPYEDSLKPCAFKRRWEYVKDGYFMIHLGRLFDFHPMLSCNKVLKNYGKYWGYVHYKVGNYHVLNEIKRFRFDNCSIEKNKKIIEKVLI